MKKLKTGEFFGRHNQKSTFEHLILTDTVYTEPNVDWHYHENAYFTYLLEGKLFEQSKKDTHHLTPGSLLFHNWQDAHCNTKPPENTRGFHVEISDDWFASFDLKPSVAEGSLELKSPLVRNLMSRIFIESKIDDPYVKMSIDALLLDVFGSIKNTGERTLKRPIWVNRLQSLLLEEDIDYSLKNLSELLDVHPIHLSREFSRYFGTSLGNYIRLLKLNKAFHLLMSRQFSMTEICYRCGFYDQSHFISNFRRVYHTTPTKLLRKIEEC